MKKILLFITAIALSFNLNAQVTTPQPSPLSKLEQKVGLTDFTIEYSRPSVKGRVIFGGLEPYGEMWRTGANKNTMITFTDDVTIMDQILKAGSYAIFTIPGEQIWEVIFYSNTENWGLPEKWDDSKVAAKVNVQASEIPFNVETFTIDINEITNNGASLEIIWAKTHIGIPFTVPTEKLVLASINKALGGANPTAYDYYAAAVYYLQSGNDIQQAKEWIDKAMKMTEKPAFYQLRQQSLIYAKAGDKKGAIALAKKSLEESKLAGNEDFVKMNMDSLAEWEK